jgi:anti-sigma B factor antagonist
MELAEFSQDGVTIVEARGRIDSANSRQFAGRLNALIKAGAPRLLVDFSQAVYISSAGFRALLSAGKLSEDQGCQFGLCGLSHEVYRLFEMGAFLDLFQIFGSRHEGVQSIR